MNLQELKKKRAAEVAAIQSQTKKVQECGCCAAVQHLHEAEKEKNDTITSARRTAGVES
jgi:hypothetical protein